VATYDAIKAAQKAARPRAASALQANGDAQYLDDYACEKDK
jgi:hypothetical protein